MSKIKVDIDRVNDLTPSFSQVTTKVSNTTDKVASIRSQIDYRIKARHGIGDQLYKISNELQTIEKNMQKLVSFLQNSMDKYADAEQKIARQVPMLPNVIGKNNITIDENGKIQVLNEYAQFNTDRPVDPNTGEYLFTYEGQRQVLGGNGSGTPDGLAQLGDLAYEFLFGDIETLFDPNASLSDKAIAAAFMLPIGKPLKAAKVAMDAVDNSKDIAKAVDKAENIKDLSKSADKTKDIEDKTISDIEVKQLGEYIKNLEKNRLIPGTSGVVTGGNSNKLGKNMMEDMGLKRSTKWSGYQAQHIIPSEMANNPVIQKIGMNFDDSSNGIFLRVPDNDISPMSRHRGYHSVYNEVVERALNKMDINKSVDSLQEQVYELQSNLKRLQENGLPLYPSQGATVELWERKLKQLEK